MPCTVYKQKPKKNFQQKGRRWKGPRLVLHLGTDEVLAFKEQQQIQTNAYEKQPLKIYEEK